MSTVTNNNAASLSNIYVEETWKYHKWIGADVNETKDKIRFSGEQLIIKFAFQSLSMTLQVIDILSDVYVCVALFSYDDYVDIPQYVKIWYQYLLVLSMMLSLVVPTTAIISLCFSSQNYDVSPRFVFGWYISMIFDLDWAIFFHSMKITYSCSKISIIEKSNNKYFLFDTSEARSLNTAITGNKKFQLDSHTFSFLLEDVPLFILNCYITHLLGNFTFVVLVSLIFSGLCVIYKGRTLFHLYWLGKK